MKRDDLDPSRGILFGLIITLILWFVLVVGFSTLASWLKGLLS